MPPPRIWSLKDDGKSWFHKWMRQIYSFRSLSCHGERGSSNVCSLQRKEGTYVNSTELSLHSGNFMTRSLALKVWINLIQKRNKVTFICTKGISVLVFDLFTLVKLFMFLLIRNSGICLMIFWIRWKLNFFKTHSEIDRYCPLNQLYCCIRKLQTREFFPVTFEFGNYLFICYPKICIRQNTDHREWWNGNLKNQLAVNLKTRELRTQTWIYPFDKFPDQSGPVAVLTLWAILKVCYVFHVKGHIEQRLYFLQKIRYKPVKLGRSSLLLDNKRFLLQNKRWNFQRKYV